MSIKISHNKYFPSDTYEILRRINQIQPNEFSSYNFNFIYNLPDVIGEPPDKIRINDQVDKYKWDRNTLKYINERRKKFVEALQGAGLFYSKEFSSKLKWRLVIGLGAAHPQETSMTLHHIYGIPYIPGSAVKGITKHWAVVKFAIHKVKNQKNSDFEKALSDISKNLDDGKEEDLKVDEIKFNDLIKIFGTQKKSGEVIFMDAFPLGDVKLKMDIMNPHYQDYYNGNNPPADWLSPNPIKFLTVEQTEFQFYLLSKNQELLKVTEKLLKEALNESGIGAKTALGYGLFE